MSFRLSADWATSSYARAPIFRCAHVRRVRATSPPAPSTPPSAHASGLCLAGLGSRPPRQLPRLCRRAGLSLRSSLARLADLACGSVNDRGLCCSGPQRLRQLRHGPRPAQALKDYVPPASSLGRRMNDAVRWANWPRCQEVSGGKFEWARSPGPIAPDWLGPVACPNCLGPLCRRQSFLNSTVPIVMGRGEGERR